VSSIESPERLNRPQIAGYGIALLSVSVAFVSTMLLQHLFPYPFLFLFFGAVMASAWFEGTAAGLFAVLISTTVVAYYFVPPFYSWTISATAEAYFVSFVVCALMASWVSSSKKKSEEALREARDQLEIRVSRTNCRTHEDPSRTGPPFASAEHGRAHGIDRARTQPAANGSRGAWQRLRRVAVRRSAES
jgi:hypothetical protein